MNTQSYYYTVEPITKEISRKEFETFLENYPRKLIRNVYAVCEPPSVTYNDFELADRWPYSVVATTLLYDDDPNGRYYEPEDERFYRIMTNYKEVFASKTGNKTED